MDLLDELQARVLCGDGAIGTLLLEGGIPLERCFEEICVTDPERIEKIHQQYIDAGARVIETNSFGGNAVRLERFGLEGRVSEINRNASQIAIKAARGRNVYVAGSVGPLGITSDEAKARGIDRSQCFREQISALLEGGAEMILFETFTDLEEMEIAFQARRELGAGVTICSFACASEARLSSGGLLVEGFVKMRDLGAQLVGVNCTDPHDTVQLLKNMPAEFVLSAYPNAGSPTYHEGRLMYYAGPEQFGKAAREMAGMGVRLIGGCCGTDPQTIAAIAGAIRDAEGQFR